MDNAAATAFLRLQTIMDELREKCPWDKKQTIETLRHLTIEETYELADAITSTDWKGIKEELGDMLLHIVFYAKIGAEQGQFTMEGVLTDICEKLVRRHPHIYGDVTANDEETVKQNWEKLKLKEGKKSVLGGVPKALPAMIKALRLQDKAKQTGFEWDNTQQVWAKVQEESDELQEAIKTGNQAEIEEEFGDLMFSMINYARFLQVDPEQALEKTNRKFINRFTAMESRALNMNRNLLDMTLEEMDDIWNQIKKEQSS
jgi:MazG family protein